MRTTFTLVLMLLGTGIAASQEQTGCDKTKFPINRERAALTAPNLPSLMSGGDVAAATATTIKLRPLSDAGLSKPPERDQKPDKFAGTLNFTSPGGTYAIAVAEYAWIDVLQNGKYLKPTDHNSLKGCEGLRKVMKFDLSAGAAAVQLSGVVEDAIKLVIFRAAD